MNSPRPTDLTAAYHAKQKTALAEGRQPGRAAPALTEAKLSRLLFLTAGMFAVAVATVVTVGLLLF